MDDRERILWDQRRSLTARYVVVMIGLGGLTFLSNPYWTSVEWPDWWFTVSAVTGLSVALAATAGYAYTNDEILVGAVGMALFALSNQMLNAIAADLSMSAIGMWNPTHFLIVSVLAGSIGAIVALCAVLGNRLVTAVLERSILLGS